MNALYIHIPFCAKKCSYCDFNSYDGLSSLIPAYFEALDTEIAKAGERYGSGEAVRTIFFGGGTPSLPDPVNICRTMEGIRSVFRVAPDAEITIESNPDSVRPEALAAYRRAGINRLSIGLQSMDAEILRVLGRIHSAEDFELAFRSARHAGFDSISADLMFGIPEQTMDQWKNTLSRVCTLLPDHLSLYSLTLDPETPISKRIDSGELPVPDEEIDRAQYHFAREFLATCGYEHYEISNFARNGLYSLHNLNYWHNGEYLGFGAGAHSHADRTRWSNIADPAAYAEAVRRGTPFIESLNHTDDRMVRSEYLFLRLRLASGIAPDDFRDRFGSDLFDLFGPQIRKFLSDGLLEKTRGSLRLTEKGLDVANIVMSAFV